MSSTRARDFEQVAPAALLSRVDPDVVAAERQDRDWYKDAIIYQLHIKAFSDSNGDGVGDFTGLMNQLEYVHQLGVTAIWLLPFYPSPLRDDGYDIAGYTEVHSSYGTLADFQRFVDAAHDLGIRVITELVINHTSDTHPWFQRARAAPAGSPERDFYVWSDREDKYTGTRIIFIDTESSNWTWDPVAKAYFWHRFYSHQPDLNFDNPAVFEEIMKAMRFWLDAGVDGLRLDAVPYLCEREGTNNENLPETHAVLRRIRHEIDERYPDRMLLAEANQWPEDTRPYFGDGDECHMAFHFPLMPRMYMALAQEDRHPITDILRQTPEIPDACQWALFLRNHDELTLEMVTAEERDYLWSTYAADPRARINLGIRRRLSALMENDRRKIELMKVLLLSMPGTPVLYYGDEIGMGDNFYLGDRDGVRTPMQWSVDRNAGFSRADPQRLFLPVLMDPIYGYQAVNVESQQTDPSSLLNWTRRMIGVRKNHKAFGRGTLSFLYPSNRRVIAFLREHEDELILCVANLSRSAQAVELALDAYRGRTPVELTGGSAFPQIGSLPYVLTMPAYGSFWFLLAEEAEVPRWQVPAPEPLPELITLVMSEWGSPIALREKGYLEKQVLPAYLPRQRWFAGKNDSIADIEITPLAQLGIGAPDSVLATANVTLASGARQELFMPFAIVWDEQRTGAEEARRPYALARVRRGSHMGTIYDGAHVESFSAALVDRLRKGDESLEGVDGTIAFRSTEAIRAADMDDSVKIVAAEQSNIAVIVGDRVLVKFYRRVEAGLHPEIEMSRFLTEEAGFANTPRFMGSIEHFGTDGTAKAVIGAFEYLPNQGDAWSVITDALERMLEEQGFAVEEPGVTPDLPFPLNVGNTLGRRTADMHLALANATEDPAFASEPVTAGDVAQWIKDTRDEADAGFEALAKVSLEGLGEADVATCEALLARRGDVYVALDRLAAIEPSGIKTRHHGDYHLGQILIVKDDVTIIDFEGEPRRSIEERRRKTSPLRDVAGLLRSFDYAAWSALDKMAMRGITPTDRIRALAFDWRDRTVAECLTAYREMLSGDAANSRDRGTDDRLLDLFLLRKAFYEVQYEIGSRPAWLAIPVRGILELLDRIGGEG